MNSKVIKRQLAILESIEKKFLLGILFITIILLCTLLFPMNVSGSSENEVTSRESYHELEMVFLDVLDMRLTNCGYAGCGITLNSIIDMDGSRTYYVQIHHKRITGENIEEWEALCAQLSDITFPAERCEIFYKLIP